MAKPPLSPSDRLRIVVLGYIVRGPVGGMIWHHLQYVLGLSRLGHDVCFIEDSGDYASCYNPSDNTVTNDPAYGLKCAAEVFERAGLKDRWAYYDAHSAQWHGPRHADAVTICETADLLLNLMPLEPVRSWHMGPQIRVLVDTDPLFTQIQHLKSKPARALAAQHNVFFSFGENIGQPGCAIPDDGLPWQPTRQPVICDLWPVDDDTVSTTFTTVMQWDSYKKLDWDGVLYGMKSDSFAEYISLPQRVGPILQLAIGSPTAPKTLLAGNGWDLRDPIAVSRDLWTYQRYIRESKAEFSVAKHGYVISNSGWFSERSAAYLASGRPVVVQDTGFSRWLPGGAGVLPFRTLDEAIAGIQEVNHRYEFHRRSARDIAETYFGFRTVLSSLLERAMQTRLRPSVADCFTDGEPQSGRLFPEGSYTA